MIGVHSVVAATYDMSCLIDSVSINHGRDDTASQPNASSATIDLDLSDTQLPAEVEIGAPLVVTTKLGGNSFVRFQGTITDIVLGWDDAGEETPNSGIGQIMATGPLAPVGRRVVGDAPFPQELDGARVSRVLALAGVTLDPLYSDPGTVAILARDIDASDALSVATEAAESGTGVIWETRDGSIRYADARHRQNILSSLTFDACDILVTPSWSRTLEGMINKVSLGWGLPVGGGDQSRVRASDDASIAKYGTYDYSVSTVIANVDDATSQALYLVTRNGTPVWIMSELPVDVDNLDLARTLTLLGLDMHALVTVTGLPKIAATGVTTANLWLEGWSERLEIGVHELTLAVSGYCRTSPPPTWNSLTPGITWDNIGALSWNDASCLGPPTLIGRWDDVPASYRWNTVDPSVSWNSWTG